MLYWFHEIDRTIFENDTQPDLIFNAHISITTQAPDPEDPEDPEERHEVIFQNEVSF